MTVNALQGTILIVDDTPANLSVLVQCLGDAGHHILVAEDGAAALELMQLRQPDLVLLDVMMPGIDGFETCRKIKAAPRTADIPVIFMTALTDTKEKLQGFEAGAVDYITKPIQHEEALARVKTHLELRQLQRRLESELELKQRFMRIASHDLRNPLCLTKFSTALARRKLQDPSIVTAQLDEIDDTVDHMQQVIDTFLELNSGEKNQPINLTALTDAVVRQHQVAAGQKSQSIVFAEKPEIVPFVKGPATTVFQIAANFLSNALKFSPPDAEITVRLFNPSAEAIRLEVSDSGPGVPTSEREKLFTENSRLTPRPTGGEKSTGYGLSIARQLATDAGGQVGANFPDAGGSIFWVELPMSD
ncbi:MAG: hybrid sensor histidine kinase/response regulator [Synoicihabitans sp.]